MSDLLKTVKSFGLTQFYFSLSVEDKAALEKYSRNLSCYPGKILSCSPDCPGCFTVTSAAQFLWATAANSLPDKKLEFAERLLTHALDIAVEEEDKAWIHANLAQVYYDLHKIKPEASKKSIHHCRELIKLGYMKSWAQKLIEEIMVFQV